MAMTTCKDCKRDISSQAMKCPHCGASTGYALFVLVLLMVILGGAAIMIVVGNNMR